MAKIPQGILGGIRGRVGNVVGGSWKGINYIRSMPLSVSNPNTAAQQTQRAAFTRTVAAARHLLADLIAPFWDPFARGMSGYNHFISQNIDAFAATPFGPAANFSAARGILTGPLAFQLLADDSDNILTFNWLDNSGSGDALATDEVYVVAYNLTQEYWTLDMATGAIRSDATFVLADTVAVAGDIVHGYLFFGRPDLSKISDSAYDNVTVLA